MSKSKGVRKTVVRRGSLAQTELLEAVRDRVAASQRIERTLGRVLEGVLLGYAPIFVDVADDEGSVELRLAYQGYGEGPHARQTITTDDLHELKTRVGCDDVHVRFEEVLYLVCTWRLYESESPT